MDKKSGVCKLCGAALSKGTVIDNELQLICKTCAKVHNTRCDKCGKLFSQGNISYRYGRNVCRTCIKTEFVACCSCGCPLEGDLITKIRGKVYCPFCAEQKYPVKHNANNARPTTVDFDLDIDLGPAIRAGEEEMRNKVNNAAAAVYLISQFDSDNGDEMRSPRKRQHKVDWGRIDEAEYDADSDLF